MQSYVWLLCPGQETEISAVSQSMTDSGHKGELLLALYPNAKLYRRFFRNLILAYGCSNDCPNRKNRAHPPPGG